MSEELKPCPFCGKPAYMADHDCGWMVECINEKCHIQPMTRDAFHREAEAIKAWNTRTQDNK